MKEYSKVSYFFGYKLSFRYSFTHNLRNTVKERKIFFSKPLWTVFKAQENGDMWFLYRNVYSLTDAAYHNIGLVVLEKKVLLTLSYMHVHV